MRKRKRRRRFEVRLTDEEREWLEWLRVIEGGSMSKAFRTVFEYRDAVREAYEKKKKAI